MSRTPVFFVERFNRNTRRYELEHPYIWNYDRTERVAADLFPYNGCHDLFSIVENRNDGFPEMNGIHYGIPADSCEEIKKDFDEYTDEVKWDGEIHHIYPNVRWFTYADMYIYYLEHPEVNDYESEDENAMMPSPIKKLMDRVNAFLEVTDGWDWRNDYSLIRIVYWIG